MTDHDLLIKLNVKIDTLCGKVDKLDKKIDKNEDDCSTCKGELYSNINNKVGWPNFKWIFGGVAGILFIAITTVGGMTLQIKDKLGRHIYYSEFIYTAITGKTWNDHTKQTLDEARENYNKHMKDIKEDLIKKEAEKYKKE